MHLHDVKYDPAKHKITYGLYGTFPDKFPKTERRERFLRKLALFFEPFLGKSAPKNPVFIVGAGRSGTSILARSLKHKDIAQYPGEALDLWFPGNFPWVNSKLDKPPFWFAPKEFADRCLAEWTERDSKRIQSVFSIFQKLSGNSVFLNKNAMSCHSLEHIEAMFPGAKYIFIVRDGRPVSVSHAEQQYARMLANPEPHRKAGYHFEFGKMLESIARAWNEQILGIEKSIEKLGLRESGRLVEIKYEDFCRSPKSHCEMLFRFMGVDPERGQFIDFQTIKPTNDRLNDLLPAEALVELTELMAEGLALKNYQILKNA